MTTKEKNLEMEEIFSYKLALSQKITYNTYQNEIIHGIAKNEASPVKRRKLKDELNAREKHLAIQKQELRALSGRAIALQLGCSTSAINEKYKLYTRAREAITVRKSYTVAELAGQA